MNSLLDQLEDTRWQFDNVPRPDGQYLKELMIKTKRKCALEIGSANGYSAIWIGLGMKVNKGQLYTIEINPSLAKQCQDNIQLAGLSKTVSCIEGSVIENVPKLAVDFDFLFLDLGPVDMLPVLKVAEEKLTDYAIIALHNISFEYSYQRLLQYVASKGWTVERIGSNDSMGYGFFIVTKSTNRHNEKSVHQ